jgi:phage terminase Nu1 subunit (DNA packaging protein)
MKAERKVTLDKLAQMLGKSRHYALDRLRAGMPYIEKGGRGKSYILDFDQAKSWCEQYDANMDTSRQPANTDAKKRYNEAQAQLKELLLKERLGQMVSIKSVEDVLADEYTRVRVRLLDIPRRVSAQIVAASGDVAQIERLLMEEVRGALTELSAARDEDEDEDEDEDDE